MNNGKKMYFPLTGTILQAQLTLSIVQGEEIGNMIYKKTKSKINKPLGHWSLVQLMVIKNPLSFKNENSFVDFFAMGRQEPHFSHGRKQESFTSSLIVG